MAPKREPLTAEELPVPKPEAEENNGQTRRFSRNSKERIADRLEESSSTIKHQFFRLFGKIPFRDEEQFLRFAKWLIFIVLIVVESLMFLQRIQDFMTLDGLKKMTVVFTFTSVLTMAEALKLFAVKNYKGRVIFFFLEALMVYALVFFVSGTYPLVLYMLVLTEFYLGAPKVRVSVSAVISSVPVYGLCYGAQATWRASGEVNIPEIVSGAIGPIVALLIHFLIVHIGLAFYRQFLKLESALKELDASKKELEKAYEVVAEVTALEERQRIAKEIHDTAGHSITTVIMQTEAAKRILEDNPEEARAKIVAANLQAKHALEELRDSVHLLSGVSEKLTLKNALLGIIHESTDGTGIKIRSEIEDVDVSETKYRFICNTLKEGISNGLRHGGATAFWFELKTEENSICFLLSDNGEGAKDGVFKEGFGLTTMRERAKSLGGSVTFRMEQDEGFEIQLVLPKDVKE